MIRIATLCATLAALFFAAVPADAGFRSGVKSMSAAPSGTPQTIHVTQNSDHVFNYTPQTHLWIKAQTSVQCKFNNELEYTMLALGKVSTAGGQIPYNPDGPFAHVETNGRESAMKVALGGLLQESPPQMCNRELARRVAAGENRIQLITNGFGILLGHDVSFLANCRYKGGAIPEIDGTGGGPGPAGWPQDTFWDGWDGELFRVYNNIRCEGRPPARVPPGPPRVPPPDDGPGRTPPPFGVRGASVRLNVSDATVDCPITLNGRGSITVNRSGGTARYRIEHNGKLGPIQELRFEQDGPRTRAFIFRLEVGDSPGGGGQTPGSNGGGGGGGIGGLASAPLPANQVSGSVRLVMVTPRGEVNASSPAGYRLRCRQKEKEDSDGSDDKPKPAPPRRLGGRKS